MMPKRTHSDPEDAAWAIRAAKLYVGDTEPETAEEARLIEEARRELPRADLNRLLDQVSAAAKGAKKKV